jgi:hypothetical protein
MTHWVQYFWQNLILKKANIKAVLYPPLGPLQNHTMQFRSRTLSPNCFRLFEAVQAHDDVSKPKIWDTNASASAGVHPNAIMCGGATSHRPVVQ